MRHSKNFGFHFIDTTFKLGVCNKKGIPVVQCLNHVILVIRSTEKNVSLFSFKTEYAAMSGNI